LALGRPPTPDERKEAMALMETLERAGESKSATASKNSAFSPSPPARVGALSQFCLTVFNLSEFCYVD
jgi:hypothetical protein